MVELAPFRPQWTEATVRRIAEFFGFHAALVRGAQPLTPEDLTDARESLAAWQEPDHELFVILRDGRDVGFLHLWYKGPIAAWIEDLFVDADCRGQGVAGAAIGLAEERARLRPGCTALCFDVAPRNERALRLYHRLGYDSLSLMTVRKELGENRRDRVERVLGLDFKV